LLSVDVSQMAENSDLIVRPHSAGFFSNFNKVMTCFVLNKGGRVFVDWTLESPVAHFPYGTSGDGNVWNAFFERLPSIGSNARTVHEYPHDQGLVTGINAYILYKRTKWRSVYHEAFRQNVRVRPHLIKRTDDVLGGLDSHFKIGVHYRHAGHNVETPFPVAPVDEVVRRIYRVAGKRSDWVVVLATDVAATADRFKREFGDRLRLQDQVGRSTGDEQFHETTNHHSVFNGEAILVDALLLSRCDVLLHVTSNVATAVSYLNPAVKLVYLETPWQRILATARWYWRMMRRQTRRMVFAPIGQVLRPIK
jgi:hypothetical protein